MKKKREWRPSYQSVDSERGTTNNKNQFVRLPTRLLYNIYTDRSLPLELRVFLKVIRDTLGFPDRSGSPNELYDKRQDEVSYKSTGELAEILFADSTDANRKAIWRAIGNLKSYGLLKVEHEKGKHKIILSVHERLLRTESDSKKSKKEDGGKETVAKKTSKRKSDHGKEGLKAKKEELTTEKNKFVEFLNSNGFDGNLVKAMKAFCECGGERIETYDLDLLEDFVRYSEPVLHRFARLYELDALSEKGEMIRDWLTRVNRYVREVMYKRDPYKYFQSYDLTPDYMNKEGMYAR